MKYQVVKTYGHNEGWSCCFRQPTAPSHCQFLHGYALGFEFCFECESLDGHNWCLDFGSLKPLKTWLAERFDHKTLIAHDDPQASFFEEAKVRGVADVLFVDKIGCEAFAEMAAIQAMLIVDKAGQFPRVRLRSVRVSEHTGNAAIVYPYG